jgi:CRISPR-associated protein Csd1
LQYWEKEIQQICALFDQESFLDDKCLTGEYLLGYYCQKDYDTKSKADKVAIKSDSVANSEINQEEV